MNETIDRIIMKLPWSKTLFQRKQALAKPGRYYGDGGTIHSTGVVNVEVDTNGRVVSVWFRCQPLPFDTTVVTPSRAAEQRRMYEKDVGRISGVEIVDPENG